MVRKFFEKTAGISASTLEAGWKTSQHAAVPRRNGSGLPASLWLGISAAAKRELGNQLGITPEAMQWLAVFCLVRVAPLLRARRKAAAGDRRYCPHCPALANC